MLISDITNSSLYFSLWVKKSVGIDNEIWNEIAKDDDIEYIEVKLLGECYLGINQLIRSEYFNQKFNNAVKSKNFETKLWLHGNSSGAIKGNLFVQVSPFLKQLLCGVTTEDGVRKSQNVMFGTQKS